jgi:PAT family beta-lactamase induction signal transducer AmpG
MWNNHLFDILGLALAIDSFCGGLLSAAFVVFLMRVCTSASAATQYALLTAAMAAGRYLTAPAGMIVDAWGWPMFFAWSMAAAMPGLLLLWWWNRLTAGPQR